MSYPFPDNTDSYWLKSLPDSSFAELSDNIEVDVTIIGGGISGIVTAYQLKQSGYRVAVLEQKTIASGTTGGTTGKLTSQHGLVYSRLMRKFGQKNAKTYGDAYERSLKNIAEIVKRESINCSYEKQDNYVYTTYRDQLDVFEREATDAASLGLPVSLVGSLDLPFDVVCAVKFANQAKMNAYDFTHQLAKRVAMDDSFVFENSKALSIKDSDPCLVKTKRGSVRSKYVVITTLIPPLPMFARFGYAAVEYPETSYIVSANVKKRLKGMYISPDPNHYSILQFRQGSKNVLLVGGESHIPGLGSAKNRQTALADYARKWFGAETVNSAWGAMDYMAYDGLPLIGRVYPWSKNLLVISGLKKWGLAGSMVGAETIVSIIQNEETDQVKLFTPHRLSAPLSIPETIARNFFH